MEKVHNAKDELATGIKLDLKVRSGHSEQRHSVEVLAVSGESFAVSIPMKDGYFHPIPKDTKVFAEFLRGSGQYSFDSVVMGRIIHNDVPVLVLAIPASMNRSERRVHFRVDTLIPVKIIITEIVGTGNSQRVVVDEYEARCVDISGGGIQLDAASSRMIPFKRNLMVDIDFGGVLYGLKRVKGVATRPPLNSKSGWGLKFTQLSDSNQDKIIRYVFKRQREGKAVLE